MEVPADGLPKPSEPPLDRPWRFPDLTQEKMHPGRQRTTPMTQLSLGNWKVGMGVDVGGERGLDHKAEVALSISLSSVKHVIGGLWFEVM